MDVIDSTNFNFVMICDAVELGGLALVLRLGGIGCYSKNLIYFFF